MDLYTALRDYPGGHTAFIGVFSTEGKAQEACQDDANEDTLAITWLDAEARLPDGSTCVIMLTNLDQRAGFSD